MSNHGRTGLSLGSLWLMLMMSWGIVPSKAEAFCGFYVAGADAKLTNDATMVVLMREGARTVMSMRNTYQGPPEDFAMVVPVPVVLDEDDVKTLPDTIFDELDAMASPRLVECWEKDPCLTGAVHTVQSLPGVAVVEESRRWLGFGGDSVVKIEAQFEVGEYDIVILSASDSTGLDRWLRTHGYNIPAGADKALAPYIEGGMYFFVAKVDASKLDSGQQGAQLSPLRFHFDADTFMLPVRLGMLNAKGPQDLIVHILSRGHRYQVVNRLNVTVPTNIDVTPEVKGRFSEFYAALFDQVQANNPGAVVTEYAWDASSCDPCPGPTLNAEHFMTLGADVLEGKPQGGYVLTRLHTRYTQASFGTDDLVFATAPPLVGGRERRSEDGLLEQGGMLSPSAMNNFQARYIIRHPWTGPINCPNPVRGRWGGPPDNPNGTRATPAQNTAFAARGKLELSSMVADPQAIASVSTLEKVPNSEPRTPPAIPPGLRGPDGGCASCTVQHGTTSEGALWLGSLLGLLAWVMVRRRRQQ